MRTATRQDTRLRLDALSVRISLPGKERRWVHAVESVSLRLEPQEVTAVVGESGCGKSVLALALMGLLPAGSITAGSIFHAGVDLLAAPDAHLREIRGSQLGLIPQSSATHLNPVRTVGATMAESLKFHGLPSQAPDLESLIGRLALPADILTRYPHELSGGMAQRVLVALTLGLRPEVIIADEPTSALDAHTSALVLASLRQHADAGGTVMLITHDLIAARDVADTVAVMYAGRVLETGPVDPVLFKPRHDYTRALLDALPENGLHPVPGLPASLVDPDPTICAWHQRVGTQCTAAC